MFNDIGGKIKVFAKVVCWLGIIGSCIVGIVAMEYSFLAGLLYAVVGSLCSWISSFFAYGFGELIENSAEIASNTLRISTKITSAPAASHNSPAPAVPAYAAPVTAAPVPVAPAYAAPVTAAPAPVAPAYTAPVTYAAPAAYAAQQTSEATVNEDGSWTCPQCKRRNLAGRTFCWSCGHQK